MTDTKTIIYNKSNILYGAVIYASGDVVAALILGEFAWIRLLCMIILGGTVYALEIRNYFAWIERKTDHLSGVKKTFGKTGLAMAYFNPLWIARHLLFIKIFSNQFDLIDLNLLKIAWISFLFNIPISLIANYVIQNKIHLNWRFLASSIFSALMAVYYAFSEILFN